MTATTPPAPDPTQTETPDRTGRIVELELDALQLAGENHRDASLHDDAALRSLAESIAQHGLRQPVLVNFLTDTRPQRYELVYGHRRLAAVKSLGHTTIRAEVRDNLPADEVMALRAIENLQRQDLNVMEQCVAVAHLIDAHKGNVEKAAADLGQELAWVRERWWIHERVSPKTKALALRGLLKIGHLRQLIKLGDPKIQDQVAGWGAGGTADGADLPLRLESVEWFKRQVESHERSLRSVRWELDQTFARKPACVGCPDNTATDAQLFETGAEGDQGRCLNRACFDAKTAAADKAVELTVEKLRKKDAEPTAANVDQAKPDWLRRSPMQRAAKKALGGEPAKAAKSTSGSSSSGKAKLSPLGAAVKKYKKACEVWEKAEAEKVADRIRSRPALLLGVLVLPSAPWTREKDGAHEGEYWSQSKAEAPGKPAAVSKTWRTQIGPALAELAAIDNDAIPPVLVRLCGDGDEYLNHRGPWGSRAELSAVAEAIGVVVDPPPVWKDFAPAKEAKAKPAAKKKAAKKKVRKKKAVSAK